MNNSFKNLVRQAQQASNRASGGSSGGGSNGIGKLLAGLGGIGLLGIGLYESLWTVNGGQAGKIFK